MKYSEISGFYGSGKTPTTVFIAEHGDKTWYVCEGSVNVNHTYEDLRNGVNVEEVNDFDMFTASKPVNSLNDLEKQIES